MPVNMLAAPVNSKVDGSEIELVMTRAVINGSRVPRSPSEPESSASGCDLSVRTLCLWFLWRRGNGFVNNGMLTRA
jgi:hypothetical protein